MSVRTSESDNGGTETTSHVEFVRVRLGTEAYVFEVGCVNKLIRSPSVTRVPRTGPTIAGVTEVHGDVTAAIDGRALLGNTDRSGQPRILVVFAGLTGDQTAGMLVDAVEGIETHPVEEIEPANVDPRADDLENDPFKAVVDGELLVLSPERLIDAAPS